MVLNLPPYKFGREFAKDACTGATNMAVPMGEGGGCRGSIVGWGMLVSCGSLLAWVESASARHPSGEVCTLCSCGAAYVLGWRRHHWNSLWTGAVFVRHRKIRKHANNCVKAMQKILKLFESEVMLNCHYHYPRWPTISMREQMIKSLLFANSLWNTFISILQIPLED